MKKITSGMIKIIYLAACFVATGILTASAQGQSDDAGFTSLFDGKTLNGWSVYEGLDIIENSNRWRVEDGVIVGTPHESCGTTCINSWLGSDREYSDFVLRFKFKVDVGNSGFTYRSIVGEEAVDSPEVDLSEAADKTTGQIYETRTLNNTYVYTDYLSYVDTDLLDSVYKTDGFNEIELQLKGPNVKIFLNGTLMTDYDHDVNSPAGRPSGFIAMELHQDTIAYFKDIRIREW